MGVVIENRWWYSLKYRIRDFAIKSSHKLRLDRAKKTKALDDRLSEWRRGDSLAVDLVRNLEHEASKHYRGFIVRSRLKKVPNEAEEWNSYVCEGETRRFPHWYIESVKSLDGHMLWSNRETFRMHFCDSFACLLISCFRSFAGILPTSPTLLPLLGFFFPFLYLIISVYINH